MKMGANFEEDIILENDRVILKSLKSGDLDHLLVFAEKEPDLWKYSLYPANGKTNMEIYLDAAMRSKNESKSFPFIVYDKMAKAYAGSTRFYDINQTQKNLLLGYTWYGKKFQGTGLNKNCKFLLLQYAFEIMQMLRVELRADNNNERSKAAMRSIGATQEGILRSDSYKTDGTRRDSVVFSILKEEWFTHIKEELQKSILLTNT